MRFAKRVGEVPEYLFSQITRKIAAKEAKGIEVISFGIGDPDQPTPDHVLSALRRASSEPSYHRYPETNGMPEFRDAVANWYLRRFGVSLDPESEVVSLIGAKEGIGHVSLCFINPGDTALIPNPGYPVYSAGTVFAGGNAHWMPLKDENGWLPDVGAIPTRVANEARVMWLNYPNNPTGAVAGIDFFDRVVTFAKKHNIIVFHDACYTEVAYNGFKPVSFLQADGAKDVGIEFHSLSKTYNMTGWRLGMAVGNSNIIESLTTIKSNLDSGVPQSIQMMGVEAMNAPLDSIDDQVLVYQKRRDRVVKTLQRLGLRVQLPRASLYVWAKVPEGYTSADFTELMLEDRNVLVSAGSGYGRYGEGYIRLSLTLPDVKMEAGLERLASWEIPSRRGAKTRIQ